MKINNALHKRTSLTNNENREWGRLNNIEGIVADNINKVRGIRSNRLFWEEGGSFKNLETAWIKGEALVTVAGARKGIMSVWGTGGDSDASALEGLSKMFNNPKEYNVLPYKIITLRMVKFNILVILYPLLILCLKRFLW